MDEGVFLPSKLMDYVSAARPVLALSPANGCVADVLRFGGGIRVGPDDVDASTDALQALYLRWKDGTLDELAPTQTVTEYFSPSRVVPRYEEAFAIALRALY